MKTDLAQTHIAVTPGRAMRVDIEVTNTDDVIDGVTAIVDGINPDWVRLERPLISLFPDSSDRLTVIFEVPLDCPAGDYLVVVRIVSTIDPDRQSVHDFWMTVDVVSGVDVSLRPSIITGGKTAMIDSTIINTGNASAEMVVTAIEPTRSIEVRVDPNRFVIGQGAEALLPIHLRGPRPWFGQPAQRQVHIAVESGGTVVEKVATFNQKARIPRGLITALTLIGIVALWAFIFFWVVSELRGKDAPEKALGTFFLEAPENIPLAAIAGTAQGTVTASTSGEGLARITVEALRVTADGQPVSDDGTPTSSGSAATDDDGAFELPSLLPGTYQLRFSADGFDQVFYTDADGSNIVRIEPKETRADLDVVMAGGLGRLTGQIALPPGSEGVELLVTATMITEQSGGASAGGAQDGDPGADAAPMFSVTQTTTDGSIDLSGLPTPADYQVTVTGPGFETQSFEQSMGGGADSVINTVNLAAASGSITGVVTDPSGRALGGVRVIARSGSSELLAMTPTSGDVGRFDLVGLATPEAYVLTFDLAGYSSQTVSLRLEAGENASVGATLVGGSGTVTGTVQSVDGVPIGGISVLVTGDGFRGETSSLTSNGAGGSAGEFTLADLPIPEDPSKPITYTVTLSGDGFQTETLAATFTGASTQSVGTVVMLPVTASIRGSVSAQGGGLGEVLVTLTDGLHSQVTTSATTPAGTYAFANVVPGSYTITFARPGYGTQVVLVALTAGSAEVQDVRLQAEVSQG